MADLVTIRTRLRKSIGNPDTVDVPDSDLNQNINDSYREIANKFRFHSVRKICQFDTIDGTDKYGIPVDASAVLRVRDNTNEKRLEKLGDRRAAEQLNITANIQKGAPESYVRHRTWIEIFPIPDAVYQIEMLYKATVTDLVSDSDAPIIPVSWHRGIRLLAKYYYYEEKGDTPKQLASQQAYSRWLLNQPTEVDEEKRDIDSGVTLPGLAEFPGKVQLEFDKGP